jgi:hypothetical protein
MPNKQVRLDDDAVTILKDFQGRSTTLSDAIRNMKLRIKAMEMTQSVSKPVPATVFSSGTATQPVLMPTVPPVFDAVYWKKLSETVDSCIERAKRY